LEQSFPTLQRGLPDEISQTVQVTDYKDGRVESIMLADRVERFYDRRILNAYQVKITTLGEDDSIRSVVLADTAIVDDARNIIFANGNVRLSSPNGSIQTRKLTWDRNIDDILAPEQVTLTRDQNVLRGVNLRTNSLISFAEMDNVSAEGIVDEKDIDW